jgi:predicted nucleotidyltransferase
MDRVEVWMKGVTEKIQIELDRIEREESVRILYACESGSRAWGFESADSDYDVRFFYIRPPRWYLSIQNKRDVIEKPIDDELDISGWDITKALELYRKSNPPLLEWLQSPIVYRENGTAAKQLRQLLADYFAPISCMYHYLHMAQVNYRAYSQEGLVSAKKSLYVLRPLLACIWIENDFGPVPMEFAILKDRLVTDDALRNAIDQLIAQKRLSDEADQGSRIPEITEFIDVQIGRLSVENQRPSYTKEAQPLDDLFVELLIETYGTEIQS